MPRNRVPGPAWLSRPTLSSLLTQLAVTLSLALFLTGAPQVHAGDEPGGALAKLLKERGVDPVTGGLRPEGASAASGRANETRTKPASTPVLGYAGNRAEGTLRPWKRAGWSMPA